MARRSRSRVVGTEQLERKLAAIGAAIGEREAMEILREAARPFADDMRARAPRRTGELAGSIGVSEQLSPRQAGMHVPIAEHEIHVGPGPNPQAIMQEFGTFKEPPQPSVRPSWDANKRTGFSDIKRGVARKIRDAI
jgi:HK97 gp10 family phage protein